MGAIRNRSTLPDDIREIAICRVGLLNKAWFEFNAHTVILRQLVHFTDSQFEVVSTVHPTSHGALDQKQWAVLRYADSMTTNVEVAEPLFAEAKSFFSEQEMVELTLTIAAYNMATRFLVALDIGDEAGPNVAVKSS
jgi:alkylhydroperoxidase family enzyme